MDELSEGLRARQTVGTQTTSLATSVTVTNPTTSASTTVQYYTTVDVFLSWTVIGTSTSYSVASETLSSRIFPAGSLSATTGTALQVPTVGTALEVPTSTLLGTSSSSYGSLPTSSTQAAQTSQVDISAGASAVIGIGVALGILLLCALGFVLWFLRSKRKTNHEENGDHVKDSEAAETDDEGATVTTPEAHSNDIHEMGPEEAAELDPDMQKPAELTTRSNTHEL